MSHKCIFIISILFCCFFQPGISQCISNGLRKSPVLLDNISTSTVLKPIKNIKASDRSWLGFDVAQRYVDNIDFIEIKKNLNGLDRDVVFEIKGGVNSNDILNNTYTDNNISDLFLYYELKQPDFDSNFKYSDYLYINPSLEDYLNSAVYVNSYIDKLFFYIKAYFNNLDIVIFRRTAKCIFYTEKAPDLNDLSNGLCFINIKSNSVLFNLLLFSKTN